MNFNVPTTMNLRVLPKFLVKVCKILVLVLVVFNGIYFAVYKAPRGITSENLELVLGPVPTGDVGDLGGDDTTNPKKIQSNKQSSGDLVPLPYKHRLSQYNQKLAALLSRVESEKARYWLANTDITEPAVSIPINRFLDSSSNSWSKKNELFFDPRFTLAVYLNELKEKYVESSKQKPWGRTLINTSPIELPFNWADWIDLTVLNKELKKPPHRRVNCAGLQKLSHNNPNPKYFCMPPSDFPKEQREALGYNSLSQLPGFIIHNHESHDDRTYNDQRVMQAKAHAMTHLPRPYKVIILNGEPNGGGTYEFDVSSNSKRMIKTNMVDHYVKAAVKSKAPLDDDTQHEVRYMDQYRQLLSTVRPQYLTEEEDVRGMFQSIRAPKDSKSSRELHLDQSLFEYPKESAVKDQIFYYETKANLKNLTKTELTYYNSLKECSKYNDNNEPTYFKLATIRIDDDRNRENDWGWHYDWRFFNGALNYERDGWSDKELILRTNIILDRLLRNWYLFAEEKGIVSWLMHGPLLSWYWDGLMFPFDLDIDIQMPIAELTRLTKEYNQTLVVENPSEGYGKYLIDVGTFIHNRGISKNSNHIDARFIDVDSGIYIDITALSKSDAVTPPEYKDNSLVNIEKIDATDVEIYNDRRKHFYTLPQLSPLRYSMMGGVPLYVPSTISDRLTFEYSKGLKKYEFNNWFFVRRLSLWLQKDVIAAAFEKKEVFNDKDKIDTKKLLGKIAAMTDEEVLGLLDNDDEVLVEYYLTKKLTDTHLKERNFLFDPLERDNLALLEDEDVKKSYSKLTSTFKMSKPLRKPLYDYEMLERLKH